MLAFGRGAVQRFGYSPPEHELPAQNFHRLQRGLADHRFAQSPHRALERSAQARRLCAPLVEHLPGQHQREGRGVDEGAAAFAHMITPVDPGQLVVDQRVGGGGIGHAQQSFGEAHQRDAFIGAEPVGLQKGIEPAGFVFARALHQPRGNRARPGMDLRCGCSLAQPLGNAGLLVHPVGQAKRGAIDRSGHGPSPSIGCERNQSCGQTCKKTQSRKGRLRFSLAGLWSIRVPWGCEH